MKAVRYHSYGDSGVLAYEEASRPAAGPGQVVLRVAGAAFNPVDAAIRAGVMQQAFPVTFPHIPNFDVSGVVAETGEGVTGWSAGDAVVAFLPMNAGGRGGRVRRRARRGAGGRPAHGRAGRRRGAAVVGADGLAGAVRAR